MPTLRNLQRLARLEPQTLLRQLRVLQSSLAGTRFIDHDLTVSLCTSARLRRLNESHRGLPVSTDVLSFPLAVPDASPAADPFALVQDPAHLLASPHLSASASGQPSVRPPRARDLPRGDLGSIAVSLPHVVVVARERSLAPADYLLAVLAHGIAHLVGHTHARVDDTRAMRDAEREALVALYADAGAWSLRHPSPASLPRMLPKSYIP